MAETKYHRPSELLEAIDSHLVYNVKMLDECSFETEAIPCQTVADTRAEIAARGLGGFVEGDEGDWLFAGWKASAALARAFVPGYRGSRMQGRGSAFREDLAALKAAGH